MNIELLGLSGVRIQSGDKTILLSPPAQDGELKASRMKAEVAVLGRPDDKINVEPTAEKLFVIAGAGEYESAGVFFYCLSNQVKDNIKSLLTSLTIEDMEIAHLGSLGRDLTEKELETFEGTDILLIPVGGNDVLDTKKASQLVAEIEPRIVIPMHFNQKGLKTKYDDVTKFLKEMGAKEEAQARLKINKKDLPQEGMKVIYLQP